MAKKNFKKGLGSLIQDTRKPVKETSEKEKAQTLWHGRYQKQ